jgi:RNA polymerase sigma-70 factor (sigma-E family)
MWSSVDKFPADRQPGANASRLGWQTGADLPSMSSEAHVDEFDSFVRARTPALLRSAYLLTGDQHLAEDLVQSALARTHQSWRRLHDAGNAEAYTRRTMYHLQVSWWRRGRVAESLTEDLPEPRPRGGGSGAGGHATGSVTRITLQAALLKLTSRQQAVLVLRFFEDRTEAEAAEMLGVSVGTVKSQTAKALARLRAVAPELHPLKGSVR